MPRIKLPAPRYVVRYRDGRTVEHRTLLGAMKAARTLVDAGHHDVSRDVAASFSITSRSFAI